MEVLFPIMAIAGGIIALLAFTVFFALLEDEFYGWPLLVAAVATIICVAGGIGWNETNQAIKQAAEEESGLVVVDSEYAGKRTFDQVAGPDGCLVSVELIDGKFYLALSENSAPLTQEIVDDICTGGPR